MTIGLMDQNHDHLQDVTAMTGAEIMRLDDAFFPGSESETDCKDGVSNMSAPDVGIAIVVEHLGPDELKRFAQE